VTRLLNCFQPKLELSTRITRRQPAVIVRRLRTEKRYRRESVFWCVRPKVDVFGRKPLQLMTLDEPRRTGEVTR
jgi:hypothetical protein